MTRSRQNRRQIKEDDELQPKPREPIDLAADEEVQRLDALPDPDPDEEPPPAKMEGMPEEKREQVAKAWKARTRRAIKYIYSGEGDE